VRWEATNRARRRAPEPRYGWRYALAGNGGVASNVGRFLAHARFDFCPGRACARRPAHLV
jgi:hypothetical protein